MTGPALPTPPGRSAYLRAQKRERGRRLCGVFPAQYPREILWALDLLPVEIWDPPVTASAAGAHLQPYICSVARSGLEFLLGGGCRDLDAFLFPHTCDSLQNLASVVNDFIGPDQPCYPFYHPKAPYRHAARTYYRGALQALAERLGDRFGSLRPDRLATAVVQGQRMAALLRELYELRARRRLPAPAAEFYRLIRGGEYLHPEDFIPLLEQALATARPTPEEAGTTVVLCGVLPNPRELLTLLDDLKVRVGHDDLLACGRRLLAPPVTGQDPLATLVEAYFGLPPCTTRNASLAERKKYLFELISKSGAQGVIFNIVKFCETEFFDIPVLTEALRSRGVAALILDTELHGGLTGQLATRVEAFFEMLPRNRP